MRHPDAGRALQQLAHEMGQIADAERAVIEFAGTRLRAFNEIPDRLDPGSGIDHRSQRIGSSLRDRGEVAEGVVGQLFVDERVRSDRAHRSIDQRIAVGLRLGSGFHSDNGVGAGAVLHDALLAPELAHLLGENARLQIHAGACRLRHDDANGTVGVIVGRLGQGAGGKREHRHAQEREE